MVAAQLCCLSHRVKSKTRWETDMDTEGLLLFSNDGEFINRLTHRNLNVKKNIMQK